MSGPPPKPTAQLKLSGSPRAAARKDHGALPSIPTPPPSLSPAALAQWHILIGLLSPLRVVTDSDQLALAHFAEYLAQWKKATDNLAKFGEVMMVRDSKEQVIGFRRSPYVALQLEYGLMVRRYSQEFGLTPSARSVVEGGNWQGTDTTFSRSRALA